MKSPSKVRQPMPTTPVLPPVDAVPLRLRAEWSRKLRLHQLPGGPRLASAQRVSRWFLYPTVNQLLLAFCPSCPFLEESQNPETNAHHTPTASSDESQGSLVRAPP